MNVRFHATLRQAVGVVKQLHVEAPGEFRVSSADYVLEQLGA